MKIKLKKLGNKFIRITPLILTTIVFIVLLWTLSCKLYQNEKFSELLAENRTDILTISGFIAGLIIAYLTAKVLQIRQEKIARLPELIELTQKLHKCRSVIDKLIHSDLWPEGVKYLVDKKYKGLTYFEVRENVFVNSKPTKQAIAFIEDKECGGLANLYLQLKSFQFNRCFFDKSLFTEFDVPMYYSPSLVQKWINYDCGYGLWYYFDYKYVIYKKNMNLDDLYDGDKEKIVENCLRIDQERYRDLEFRPELLAKLGTQLTEDILPKLVRIQRFMDADLPRIIKYLFVIAGLLIVFGVSLPLLNNIYSISPNLDIISIVVIVSTIFYLIISFYGFMKREIRV